MRRVMNGKRDKDEGAVLATADLKARWLRCSLRYETTSNWQWQPLFRTKYYALVV